MLKELRNDGILKDFDVLDDEGEAIFGPVSNDRWGRGKKEGELRTARCEDPEQVETSLPKRHSTRRPLPLSLLQSIPSPLSVHEDF